MLKNQRSGTRSFDSTLISCYMTLVMEQGTFVVLMLFQESFVPLPFGVSDIVNTFFMTEV
jgi:hypothetical protein|tara:strand:+ start:146 stop:325 length:180 start_codon:yes stop_codon:yes gene_type:complete